MKGFAHAYIELLKWNLKNMAFFFFIKISEIEESDLFLSILNYFVYLI